MKIRRRFKLLLLAATVLCFSYQTAQAKYFLITHGSADYYWHAMFNGAKAAAKNLGVQLQIVSPPGANDVAAEVRLFSAALATHPQGIASTLPSNTAFSSVLQKAKAKKIPVVAVDTKPMIKAHNPYLAFLGSDNYQLGVAEATTALQQHKIKRAMIANPQPGQTGLERRAAGIKSVLNSHNITVDELNVGTDPSKVQQLVKAYVTRHPKTNAIFCLTSQSLIPIGQLLKKNPHALGRHHLSLYTFDNTPLTAQLIKDNIVDFTTNQQPYLMGYFAITELVLKHRYGLQPVSINTGYGFVNQTNITQVLPLINKGIR